MNGVFAVFATILIVSALSILASLIVALVIDESELRNGSS